MDLATAMRREFATSKRYWRCLLILQLLGSGVATWVVLGATGGVLLILGAFTILVPLLSFVLKQIASKHHHVGNRLRRWLILHDSIGWSPSNKDLLEIQADASWLPTMEPSPAGSYYDSQLPQGTQRMGHIIQESSFYTWKQAEWASRASGTIAVLGVALAIGFLWVVAQQRPEDTHGNLIVTGQQAAKMFSTLLVFFATGSFATLWSSYRSLAATARTTFRNADDIRGASAPSMTDIYLALAPYDGALAESPPLPTPIYWILRNRLGRAWKQHMSPSIGNEGHEEQAP